MAEVGGVLVVDVGQAAGQWIHIGCHRKAQAHSVSGCWVGILPDDQDLDGIERISEGAQHVRTRGQVPAAGRDLGPQEQAPLGGLVGYRTERAGPALLDEIAQRARRHCSPFTSSTTVSAPARRSFEMSWYFGDCAQPWNAAPSGNDISTSFSRSHRPSMT